MIGSRLLATLAATVALVLRPAAAHAQLEKFVDSVRGLADAGTRAEPERSAGIRAAAAGMAAALDMWDRNIRALEARLDRARGDGPAARAYELHVELGVACRARGRLTDAVREFDAALSLRPSADVQLLRALTLEAAGRGSEATHAFRAAWQLDPGDPTKAYLVAQQTETGAQDRDRARALLIDTYTRSLAASSAAGPARPDRRAAAAPFVTLDAAPDNLWPAAVIADGTTAEGFALLRARRYGEAATALSRVGRSKPGPPADSPAAHFARAQRAELENRVGDARREYQASVEGALAGRSLVLVAIGRLAQVEGDLPAAVDAFSRASRLNPNDPTIRWELAGAYGADGRHDDALAELVAAWLIDPRDAQIHAAIGQIYVNSGHEAAAVPAFERALQLRPEGYETRYALAMAHTRLGHTDEAARQLDLFDRARRDALAERRRVIANDAVEEERRRKDGAAQDGRR